MTRRVAGTAANVTRQGDGAIELAAATCPRTVAEDFAETSVATRGASSTRRVLHHESPHHVGLRLITLPVAASTCTSLTRPSAASTLNS